MTKGVYWNKHLPMNITEIMASKGIGPSKLAERTGLSRQAIHQIMRGGGMRLETAKRIADSLGVHPYDLLLPSTPSEAQHA